MSEYLLAAILLVVAMDWYEHSAMVTDLRRKGRKARARLAQWWKNTRRKWQRRGG